MGKTGEVLHIEGSLNFIDILDGEIVRGGDYRNREECNHDIMGKEQPIWEVIKITLIGFIFSGFTDDFVTIVKALKKDSKGYSIAKEICQERPSLIKSVIGKKTAEIKRLEEQVLDLQELL